MSKENICPTNSHAYSNHNLNHSNQKMLEQFQLFREQHKKTQAASLNCVKVLSNLPPGFPEEDLDKSKTNANNLNARQNL